MVVPEPINDSPDGREGGGSSSSDEIAVSRNTMARAAKLASQVDRAPHKEDSGADGGSAVPAKPAVVVFDRAQLMARAMGDSELVGVVIDGFLEDFPRQLEILKGDLDLAHAEDLKRRLHNMKGVASTVAGLELQQWAARMEETAKAGDMSALKGALPGLEDCFARLEIEMRK